jgi:hypothetical protein
MKAIYLNIDPYLQAVADWLNAGKPGTAPSFDPLPVAVTVPLGQDAVILVPGDTAGDGAYFVVDGTILNAVGTGDFDATADPPPVYSGISGYSAYPAPEDADQKYVAWTASNTTVTMNICDGDGPVVSLAIPVLVRREQPSGPVDLVDFAPPAAAPSAADIKSTLVAAGSGALAGVDLGGAIIIGSGADGATLVSPTGSQEGNTIQLLFSGENGATLGAAST